MKEPGLGTVNVKTSPVVKTSLPPKVTRNVKVADVATVFGLVVTVQDDIVAEPKYIIKQIKQYKVKI